MFGFLRRRGKQGEARPAIAAADLFHYSDGVGDRTIDPAVAMRGLDRCLVANGGFLQTIRFIVSRPHPELSDAQRVEHVVTQGRAINALASSVCEVFAVMPIPGDEPRPGGLTLNQQVRVATDFFGFFVERLRASGLQIPSVEPVRTGR